MAHQSGKVLVVNNYGALFFCSDNRLLIKATPIAYYLFVYEMFLVCVVFDNYM